MGFSQCERGNLAGSHARQIFLLLFFGSKQKQRLRNAD